jgi:hypothetical protein
MPAPADRPMTASDARALLACIALGDLIADTASFKWSERRRSKRNALEIAGMNAAPERLLLFLTDSLI